MRCVLPHIPSPWNLLSRMAESSPGALALIEFQTLDWIIANHIWYQISHDHVNLFSLKDFRDRYTVLASGEFQNSEWGWVLIDPGSFSDPPVTQCTLDQEVREMMRNRSRMLKVAATCSRRIAIWGAAGKGIVLAHALREAGVQELTAVDADPNRWERFLETSGVRVISPVTALAELPKDTLVLVCNPNHLPAVEDRFGDLWQCELPSAFLGL